MLLMRFETPYRRYTLRVYKDMLGDYILCRTFSGRQNNLGGMDTVPYATEKEAVQAMTQLAVKRVKRKYRPV